MIQADFSLKLIIFKTFFYPK